MKAAKTPIRCCRNVVVKMEAFNPGGSHKFRAAEYIVNNALKTGRISATKSVRLLEKTGGNFGIGLACAATKYGIGVDLVVGNSFLKSKKALCKAYGANLVGQTLLDKGLQPGEIIERLLDKFPNQYFFTDQFSNRENLTAHSQETGPEIVSQITQGIADKNREIVLVKGAGTGASFVGIATSLKKSFPKVECHLVFPEGCDLFADQYIDHPIDGIAVGRRPPFLDFSLVDKVHYVNRRQAALGQRLMAHDIQFFPGRSSGAVYSVAKKVATENLNQIIVTVAYDSGEAYVINV